MQALIDAATAAWVGSHTDLDGFQDFVRGLDSGPKQPLPPEAQARALDSMQQKMAVITMDDYRARLRGR